MNYPLTPLNGGSPLITVLVLILLIWTLFWKGYSLWVASRNDQKKWFVALLIFNTFGILEIIYVFHFAKKKWADVNEVFTKSFWAKKA